MTQDKSPWVALKPLRFGTETLQPGDPVPVQEGRNYHQMLRLGQIGPASAAPAGQQEEPQALKGRTAFLELLVQAIRTEGTPLADDTPNLKDLQANHINTVEGLKLLAEGEQGRANLIALDRIGDKSADKILAYLNPSKGE